MKKKIILSALCALCVLPTLAQRTLTDIAQSATFGGYIIGRYQGSESATADKGFDIRMLRLYVNGTMFDQFKYRVQMEATGFPGSNSGVRLLDAYGEWVKHPEFTIRAGQMKRVFTFENPYHPWEQGFGAYSQVVTKLSGFSDRVGEHSSGGRDLGLVIQGDLFPIRDIPFVHYQIGVYNGQGINKSEDTKAKDQANHNKDVIGGIYLNPVKGLSVGAFGWTGKYYHAGTDETYSRNRMAYGIKYEGDYSFRAEYISSQGYGPTTIGDKADGWYVAAGAPLGEKVRVYGKWDVYRAEKSRESQSTIWGLSGEYWFAKNLKLQANYTFTEKEKGLTGDRFYNGLDVELYIRF